MTATVASMPALMSVIDIRSSSAADCQYPRNRKRKWHTKVLTGCMKCKARRVKCDESKPKCLRCDKLGIQCPGYNVPVARLFEPHLSPHLPFDSDSDRAKFDLFVKTGSRVLGSFQLNSLPFWTTLAPQISAYHPAVRHGLTALGAIQAPLHGLKFAELGRACPRPDINECAISHMSKAIHLFRVADIDALPVEVSLACCLVFTAMQFWVEKTSSASVHILAMYRLLQGKSQLSSPGPAQQSGDVLMTYLPVVKELVAHACAYSDGFPPESSGIPANYHFEPGIDQIKKISNAGQALERIDRLLKCVLRFTSGTRIEEATETMIAVGLHQIHDKIQTLRAAGMLSDDVVDYSTLTLHHRVVNIMFHTLGRPGEMGFDKFHTDFEFINRCCRKLIEFTESTPPDGPINLRPTLGLLPPLFFVSTRCRDPSIRGEAVELLHRASVSERGLSSCLLSALARFIIDEEHALNAIPVDREQRSAANFVRRIRLQSIDFSSFSNTAHLVYTVFDSQHPGTVSCSATSPFSCYSDDSGMSTESSSAYWTATASVPYPSHPYTEIDGVTCPIPRKVVYASGYTGIVFFTPPVKCHCLASPLPLSTTVSFPISEPMMPASERLHMAKGSL